METNHLDLTIDTLGERRLVSPISGIDFIDDNERILFHSDPREVENFRRRNKIPPSFEVAGPRKHIYFNPAGLHCGVVTCGGLCPGTNDVIRAIVLSLFYHYGIKNISGFRYGLEGLNPAHGHVPLELAPERVDDIHQKGGTILGTSRGPQDIAVMVDTLVRKEISILFVIGGDGTMRAGSALAAEIKKRGLQIAVVGIPKTIDNDIAFVHQSFGFETAVTETGSSIYAAHMEAVGARNGIGLVKLMGRESGFIAAYAALASSDVNFCLVPEVRFTKKAFLQALRERLSRKHYAVIVAAEGAGQDLIPPTGKRDASGNIRLGDIGAFLQETIREYFESAGIEYTLKYIDPSYTIRSVASNAHDSVFCLLLGHNAVHAGMAGCTDMLVGYWKNEYTHMPISLAVSQRKKIDPTGRLWNNVLASTGQPDLMC
jgi:6-phosphofructokinase 1